MKFLNRKFTFNLSTIFFIIAFIIFMRLFFISFRPLPIYTTDGSWAREFLESSHSRNSSNIYELAESSNLVVRVEVLDRRIEIFGWGDTQTLWEQFYVYRLKILEVYKEDLNSYYTLQQGDIIEIFQYKRLTGRQEYNEFHWPNPLARFDMIPADINCGDDLVVFLIGNYPFLRGLQDIHTDTRFARLRHTRQHINGIAIHNHRTINRNAVEERIRGTPANPNSLFILTNQVQGAYRYVPYTDTFESVNPHNNLLLTRENLERINSSY